VDDNKDSAATLGMLLKCMGADVRIANDGQSALSAMETQPPDVVLLDIGMPGMDGFEVARRVRKRPEFASVQLIALTGWGQEEDRRRTSEAGFDHHLVKPVDLASLEPLLAPHS
jgi:CheY-like chemotaxis protein